MTPYRPPEPSGSRVYLPLPCPSPAAASPHGLGGLRYVTYLALPDGGCRLYYEATREDGAHEFRTEYVPPSG